MIRPIHSPLAHCAAASLGVLPFVQPGVAQEERGSLAGEAAAEARSRAAVPERYNILLGSGGVNFSAGLRGDYTDNVFLRHENAEDDLMIIPELNCGAFFPIGRYNTFALNLGLAYYYYVKHNSLNSEAPLVNPDSELVFNIYTGDFAIKLSENFSYQESPFHEYGNPYYNVYNTGRFARFDNRVGPSVTWDLHDLILHAGYAHRDFFSNGSTFEFIDRSSELFNADALLAISPAVSTGLEATGSAHSFPNRSINDQWRAAAGPTARLALTEFVTLRVGAGYQTIQYDSESAKLLGVTSTDTYYFYANLEQIINRAFSHSLGVSHDSEVGINAGNLEGTHVTYALRWRANEKLTVSPFAGVHFYEESYGSGDPSLYNEKFTFVEAGFTAQYRFERNWRAGLSYSYRLKDSDIESFGYQQNLARVELTYQF